MNVIKNTTADLQEMDRAHFMHPSTHMRQHADGAVSYTHLTLPTTPYV